jgi:hypothetical protein
LAKASVEAISAAGVIEPAIPRSTVRRLHEISFEELSAFSVGFTYDLPLLEMLQYGE